MVKAKLRIINHGAFGGHEVFVTLPGFAEERVPCFTSNSGACAPCNFASREAAIRAAKQHARQMLRGARRIALESKERFDVPPSAERSA